MYGNAYERIELLVRTRTPLPDGMSELLGLCRNTEPSQVWDELLDLDYEIDFRRLTTWLERLLANEPPPPNTNGLWFGLCNPYLDDGKPTSCLYLAGSDHFDASDHDFEWACVPNYFPEGRYSRSSVLTTIYRALSVHEGDVASQGEYTLCLGYSCMVVAEWCRGPQREKLLDECTLRGVAVGFDSGDSLLIDVLKPA